MRTVNQAQLALKLIDMNFTEDDSMAAATECSSLYTALCFLQQECLLCAGKFCAKQVECIKDDVNVRHIAKCITVAFHFIVDDFHASMRPSVLQNLCCRILHGSDT